MTADRTEALGLIPAAHSLALRLREAGVGDDLIAECLGIEPETVAPLLVVAEGKLAAALRAASTPQE
jgi:ABC-type enterobactin transport system permease subunit